MVVAQVTSTTVDPMMMGIRKRASEQESAAKQANDSENKVKKKESDKPVE